MKIKENKGITLTSLVITIIVLIILATITTYGGSKLIKKANIENLKTNMLLVQAEAKKAVEEYNFKEKAIPEKDISEIKLTELKNENLIGKEVANNNEISTKVSNNFPNADINKCYYLDKSMLEEINIKIDLPESEYYIIEYNFDELSAEIYYTRGYQYNGEICYSLTQLENIVD